MSTNAVQKFKGPDEVRSVMAAMSERLAQLLPSGMSPDRFQATVLRTLLGNPKLMECSVSSVVLAVQSAAELGLEPSGLLGSAYLVPYKKRAQVNGQWVTVLEAQLIPGYRGLIDLARRSGEILKIEARIVRKMDEFRLDYGAAQPLHHVPFIADPSAPAEDRDPGPVVGAYMKAMLKGDPVPQVEWMSADEIEAIRKRSKAADDGPWTSDPLEMARKTVVRRGSKYLPLTTEFRTALEMDEIAERDAVAPDAAPAGLTPAQRLLAQRIEDRRNGSGEAAGTVADVAAEAAGAGQEGAGQPETTAGTTTEAGTPPEPPSTPTGEACAAVHADMGACGKPAGHAGAHANDSGRWPQARK